MESKNEINAGIRVVSMLVDHFIMTFAMMIPLIPVFILGALNAFNITHEGSEMNPIPILYGFVLAFAIYFNKDFFNGRSPAKRILKAQVVNNRTNEVAGPLRCLIRNLTIPVWPIEVLFVLINPKRRLGDYIAGTRIENYDNSRPAKRKKFKDYIIPVLVGILFTILLIIPFTLFYYLMKEPRVKYIENSYNHKLSNELSSFLSFRFRNYCDSADVKFYNKIENDSLKFVSLLFFLKNEELLDDEFEFPKLKTRITDTLNLKIQPNTYILQGKIIYKIPGHVRINTLEYNPREIKVNKSDIEYINDSTKVVKTFYNNGQLESEAQYVHGKLYGTYTEWYKNGSIKTEFKYLNGQRHGITSTWYENGQKESEILYEYNKYIKYLKKWDKNGNELLIDNE